MSNENKTEKEEFEEIFEGAQPSAVIRIYTLKTETGESLGVHTKMIDPDDQSKEVTEENANIGHYLAKDAVRVLNELLVAYKAMIEATNEEGEESPDVNDDSSSSNDDVIDEIDKQLADMGLPSIKPNGSIN